MGFAAPKWSQNISSRTSHDISLSVAIDAGLPIERIDSRNHVVRTRQLAAERAEVVLADEDKVPNKDFVLRFKVAGERVKSALVTHRDQRGGFFTLMLYPRFPFIALYKGDPIVFEDEL